MSQNSNILPLWRRTTHTFLTDLRRERGWLLAWLLLLAVHTLDRWDPFSTSGFAGLMELAILLFGLALVTKTLSADSPTSDASAALTRPLGRGALWTAKLAFIMLALWLPYMISHAVTWQGYQLSPAALAEVLGSAALLSLTILFAVAWLLTIRIQKKRIFLVLIVLFAIPGVILLDLVIAGLPISRLHIPILSDAFGRSKSLIQCRLIIVCVAAVISFGLGWLLASLGRKNVLLVCALMFVGSLTALLWNHNWLEQPATRYRDATLQLRRSHQSAPSDQSLWPTLHLTGLPTNQVATVISLSPQGSKSEVPSYSDYIDYPAKPNQDDLRDRWMTVNHAQRLSETFLDHLIWLGNRDRERPNLGTLLEKTKKETALPADHPWTLRLIIHQWRSIPLGTLLNAKTQPPRFSHPTLGQAKLDQWILRSDRLYLEGKNAHRSPWLRFRPEPHPLRLLTQTPPTNLLLTAQSPLLDEVLLAHSDHGSYATHLGLGEQSHLESLSFNLPLPIIHQDMSNLNLGDWLKTTELTLWIPEVRGILDFTLTDELKIEDAE